MSEAVVQHVDPTSPLTRIHHRSSCVATLQSIDEPVRGGYLRNTISTRSRWQSAHYLKLRILRLTIS